MGIAGSYCDASFMQKYFGLTSGVCGFNGNFKKYNT